MKIVKWLLIALGGFFVLVFGLTFMLVRIGSQAGPAPTSTANRVDLAQVQIPAGTLIENARVAANEGRWASVVELIQRAEAGDPSSVASDDVKSLKAMAQQRLAEQAAEQKAKEEEAARDLERQAAATERERVALFKKLRKRRDEVEGLTFYEDPSTPRNVANKFALVLIVQDSGARNLAFNFMYTADSWLFIEGMTISVDGVKVGPLPLNYFRVKRDNSAGRIWEWYSEAIEPPVYPVFQAIAKGKRVVVRYDGQQYYADRVLGTAEKAALATMIRAMELGPPPSKAAGT